MLIEQTVYTSARTGRGNGYQSLATSPGLSSGDVRELTKWGPDGDALLEPGPFARSINFHRLGSGAYCVSRTVPVATERDGRERRHAHTQFLVVPPGVLVRFANDPFHLLQAVNDLGLLHSPGDTEPHLRPLVVAKDAAPVDRRWLDWLLSEPAPHRLVALVEAALSSPALGLLGHVGNELIFATLLNLLPMECRTEFSFSTGLDFSPQWPFRLIAVSNDPSERCRVKRQSGRIMLDPDHPPPEALAPSHGWARLVLTALQCGYMAELADLLGEPRPGLKLDDLDPLGRQLADGLAASRRRCANGPSTGPDVGTSNSLRQRIRHAHEPHPRFDGTKAGPVTQKERRPELPGRSLNLACGPLMEKLDRLDDAVFDAIDGKPDALPLVQRLWPEIVAEIDPTFMEESREHYLRYALAAWQQLAENGGGRDPKNAIQALDVLALLFEDA